MNQNLENDEIVIDIGALIKYLKKKIIMIVAVTFIFGAAAFALTYFLIPKEYASNARVFVKPESEENYTNYSSIISNNYMVENYVEMIKGNNIQTQVANAMNLKVEKISSALDVEVVDDTQIISITATTTDASLSKQIVDETVKVFIDEMEESLGITNISIVDEAVKSKNPVSPSKKKNTAIGAAIGLVLICGFYFIKFMLDTHIHNKEESERYLGIPNLGSIPYFED